MSMIGELRPVPASLFPALRERAVRSRVLDTLMEAEGVTLDKLWNALVHVLEAATGQDTLGWVGLPLDWTDTGYGPPLLLSVDEVREVAAVLGALDDGAVRDAFDPEAMAHDGVYCQPGSDEDGRAAYLDELVALVGRVRTFFTDAAARGQGALHYLT